MMAIFGVQSAWASYNAVILADIESGRILYEERANDLNYPASLTKLMTLYLVFNALERGWLRLDQELIVSREAAATSPVKIGLAAGSRITVDDAIKSVAVVSANDMAVVLSENLIRGREKDFAAMMTEVAQAIGLKHTNFSNASGLSDDSHTSTAKDMALLAIALRQHYPQYWHYFSTPSFSYNGKSFRNGNGLLGSYPGADGLKTGYTSRSRYSLLSSAKQGDKHLVAVVLGAPSKESREATCRQLFDFGFGRAASFTSHATPSLANVMIDKPGPLPQVKTGSGNAGVQFGAFGTERAAQHQQARVRSAMGLDTYLERYNGLVRVRARMNETDANKVRSECGSKGVECFVFR